MDGESINQSHKDIKHCEKRSKSLMGISRYIPNQHGAWAMLILPFLFGLAASQGEFIHIPLFACWFFIYLFSFPVLQWIKTGNRARYRKPVVVYGAILLPLLVSLVWIKPALIWYGVLLLFFFMANIYYAKMKNERALLNDIIAILLFCSFIYPVAHIGETGDWRISTELFLLLVAYFTGTALYVKTIIRERKNIRYYYASIIYHLIIVLFAAWIKVFLAVPFLILLLRAIWLPKFDLKAKQVGMAEIGFSLMLYVSVLFLYF
ncbi:YwiC-like family protein [Paenibacillus kribbensis]|uniref:YwiC-like family protein n=1 Tax=Paenibacillus kribbensis TaxID=172713 RepID=UPI0008383BEB|nr:YwiC-like family protein [Paenibacillus kribbensis]